MSCECCQVLDERHAAMYEDMSLEQYLDRNKYSSVFRLHYLLPMCAAVWSSPNRKVGHPEQDVKLCMILAGEN